MSVCWIASFGGLIRESDPEIGFGPRGALESVCARLCDRPVIINEPRYSTVSGWIRVVIVCRGDHRRGLVRRLDLEIGFGPCGMLVTGDVMTYTGFGNRGISPFLDWCALLPFVAGVVFAD